MTNFNILKPVAIQDPLDAPHQGLGTPFRRGVTTSDQLCGLLKVTQLKRSRAGTGGQAPRLHHSLRPRLPHISHLRSKLCLLKAGVFEAAGSLPLGGLELHLHACAHVRMLHSAGNLGREQLGCVSGPSLRWEKPGQSWRGPSSTARPRPRPGTQRPAGKGTGGHRVAAGPWLQLTTLFVGHFSSLPLTEDPAAGQRDDHGGSCLPASGVRESHSPCQGRRLALGGETLGFLGDLC